MKKMVSETSSESSQLEKFHYKQELKRTFRLFGVFAIAFSVISITTGIFLNFGSVMQTVGPIGIWTFPIVGLGSLLIAFIFSEISVIVPVTGQCYIWVSKLCNPGVGWVIGWLNFCYTVVIIPTLGISFAAVFASLMGIPNTSQNLTLIAFGVITVQLLLNVFSVKISSFINNAAVITESAGILILTVLLTIFAINNHHPISNIVAVNPAIAGKSLLVPILMSFLMGFYTLVAFESAANMSDETHSASKNVPKAMILSVGLSTLFGTLFLIATTWSINNLGDVINSSSPIPFIIESNLGDVVSKLFYVVICISIFACGLVFLTHASRTVYAMARDNAFFASGLFKKVGKKTSTPVPACIFLWVLCSIFLITTTPTDLVVASAAMPCLYYIITLFSYLTVRKNIKFSINQFNLGKFGVPLIILALCWLIFGLSILSIPPTFRIGTLINIGLTVIGLVLYLVHYRKKINSNNLIDAAADENIQKSKKEMNKAKST